MYSVISRILLLSLILDLSFIGLAECNDTSLKIAYWSSWKLKCGIAVYCEHLYNALSNLGYKVTVFPHDITQSKLISSIKEHHIKVLNIQYEPGLMPDTSSLIFIIQQLKDLGIKVVITLHSETLAVKAFAQYADQLIYHKKSIHFDFGGKINFIPMGVAVYNPRSSKLETRKKYGFSEKHVILATLGFMARWREHATILESLVPWLKSDRNHHIQLLTSYNDYFYEECKNEDKKIKDIINKYSIHDQVTHITDFINQYELNERLWISDLGYLWIASASNGSSAAARDFIASRLPLVATDSSHHHDINIGTIKTSMEKLNFIEAIVTSIRNKSLLNKLKAELEEYYTKQNNNVLIMKHLEVFHK